MRHKYDYPPYYYQPPPRRDGLASGLLLAALLLAALAAVVHFGAGPVRALLSGAPQVAPRTFPTAVYVARPPQPVQVAPVPQADADPPIAPSSDKVQRPNLRPLPTMEAAPPPVIVLPAPTIPAGVTFRANRDSAVLTFRNDVPSPPPPAVEYHTEAVEAPNAKVEKPSTRRLPPK